HALGAGLAYSDEQPCDLFGNALALDPLGGDLEGLVRTADGNIWMCDEYRPALYKFDATGLMLSRFVPVGSNSYGVDLGTEAFPAVYAQRRDNRGFEAIAAWNSDIYCFVQSPLDNPDVANDANSKASRLVRIAKFNALTNAVVAEYVYLLEGATSDKLGDACAFAPGKFLVIERDSTTGSSSLKKIFEVDLAGATDISTLAPSVVGPGGTLERMTPAQLAVAGIVPVSKSVFVDIAATGYANSIDKVEGIAMRDPSTLFIINDNDFRMPLTFNRATGTFRANPAAVETTLGMITFSGNGLDPSDQDGSNSIRAWPVQGAYMPDGITSFSSAGANYYITANEGDQRVWGPFDDQTTVSAVTLDPQVFPGRTWLRNNARLGRLQIRKNLGDLDGDGDYDRIVSYGGRSFTIWNAAGQRVWDSGDFIEQHIATVYPNNFNASHTNNTRDNRSRSKGPEPEGVTTGVIGGKRYMFGLLERIGGIMAWSIDSPGAPVFQGYINMRNFTAVNNTPAAGDLGPEGIQFVSAADSPNGKPLVLLANEISGTLSIFQVDVVCNTPGDLNGDCSVNGNDLALLLGNWGGSGTGDINSDGVVGAEDLSIMLNNWI
ncbi:MAG: esterase-like activity of phytase family protein, partial [Planctomycetota bacterium]